MFQGCTKLASCTKNLNAQKRKFWGEKFTEWVSFSEGRFSYERIERVNFPEDNLLVFPPFQSNGGREEIKWSFRNFIGSTGEIKQHQEYFPS